MSVFPNNPDINRKYNYLYKLTNLKNYKIYIGVHRTDNLNDGYMGSGKLIKRAIKKYGKESFKKEVIKFFENYKDLLEEERKIVNEEFINDPQVYNIREGGYGQCNWSEEFKQEVSDRMKTLWKTEEHKLKMEKIYSSKSRNDKISKGQKEWINNNPEKHKKRMDKINKNPDKIKKMADSHRGTKRNDKARESIKEGIIKSIKNDPEKASKIRGRGMIYIHNKVLNRRKRISKDDIIPIGWERGMGPRQK